MLHHTMIPFSPDTIRRETLSVMRSSGIDANALKPDTIGMLPLHENAGRPGARCWREGIQNVTFPRTPPAVSTRHCEFDGKQHRQDEDRGRRLGVLAGDDLGERVGDE